MSEITHQEAHSLLQAAADQILKPGERSTLDRHLSKCQECSEYANNLSALETGLRTVFHAHLDRYKPAKLDLQTITRPTLAKLIWSSLFGPTGALGKVVIVAVLLLGYFVVSNLIGIQNPIANYETATILPTPNEFSSANSQSPTPSAQYTLTGLMSQACKTVTYYVQESDTLERIAIQHGISQESILEYNLLKSNTVYTGMELVIPLCNSTPSHTATIPKNTITPTTTQPQ